MYALQSKLFAHEGCYDFADAEARIARIENAMGQKATRFSDEDILDLIRERGWVGLRKRFGEIESPPDPDIVLIPARFDAPSEAEMKIVDSCKTQGEKNLVRLSFGRNHFVFFCSGKTDLRPRRDHVCRPAWRINTMNGCSHRCAYCPFGGVVFAMANLDEYCSHFEKLIEHNPWETVYLLNDASDTLMLEPEYGNVETFVKFFQRFERRYFVIHTKSSNMDFLAELDHRKRAIALFSVTSPTASRLFEPGAPTCEERLEAARKCYEAGVPVRIKFKPIIPVREWREEATVMAQLALDRMKPEVINLFVLSWMNVDTLKRCFDIDALDPEIVAAAERANLDVEKCRVAPFPHETRAMIYDHFICEIRKVDSDVPITFSTETLDMWKEFGPRLGYKPSDYICGCGAQAEPGLRRLTVNPWKVCKPVKWDGTPWTAA